MYHLTIYNKGIYNIEYFDTRQKANERFALMSSIRFRGKQFYNVVMYNKHYDIIKKNKIDEGVVENDVFRKNQSIKNGKKVIY